MPGDLRDRLQEALGNNYRIVAELGGGGMSRVFEAEEVALGRRVVIKVLPPEFAAGVSIERFRRETHLAAQLQHPHIVPVLTAGAAGDLLYYTMPRIDGESVRARLVRDGPLPIDVVARMFRDVTDALQYAHRHGVVHRDIKPDNILLANGHALVTDFGVAKALDAATDSDFTTSIGVSLGTPAYMAPEQVTADPQADHRVDIYSLGALIYEALTGKPPFTAATAQAVLSAQVLTAPEPVSARRPETPPELAQAVMRALEKNPDDRWQTAEELREHIPVIEAKRRQRAARLATRRVRRRWVAAGVLVLALLAAVRLVRRSGGEARSGSTESPAEYRASLAVLPLDNIGGAAEAYFTEGVTEEIIAQLAQVRGLKVISRTSVAALKRTALTLPQIAESLNVRNVLEGSLRRSGDSIRVTVQLIDAESDTHLWTKTYNRSLRDVFGVQEEIARAVSAVLIPGHQPVRAQSVASRTGETGAYEAYLRGTYWRQSRTREGIRRAMQAFESAIALDSSYAPAYAGLAAAYVHWASYRYSDPPDPFLALGRARLLAERAIALDPAQAEGYAALGYAYYHLPQFADSALASLQRALALRPSFAEAHAWSVVPSGHLGRLDAMLAHADTAVALDPLAPGLHTAYARGALRAGRFDLAVREARAVGSLEPSLTTPIMLEGVALLLGGRTEECARLRLGLFAAIRGACLRKSGRVAEASTLVDSLVRSFRPTVEQASVAGMLAIYYATGGDVDSTVLWMERAETSPLGFDPSLARTAAFERVRTSPRFTAALERHFTTMARRVEASYARERQRLGASF